MTSNSDKTVLLLGASSDIARSTAKVFAAQGYALQLAGRDIDALRREADDLAARTGAAVTVHGLDITANDTFDGFVTGLPTTPRVVVCAIGLLGDQGQAEKDPVHAAVVLRTNFEGPALLLSILANRLQAGGGGTIVGISSVAGDRGRGSNYVYGSAKAGFTAFLSGLRNRLSSHGVHVVTVKPGFVRTRMTAGLSLPKPLTAEPEMVGRAIYEAVLKRRDEIYVMGRWWLVMTIIRAIPESIFKTLRL